VLSQPLVVTPGRTRTLVGVILVALTLLVGAYYLRDERVAVRSATWPSQWATSDQWLAYLQIPDPSATLVDTFRSLPPGTGVVFIGPASEAPIVPTYYAISYLAAPREMNAIFCRDGQPNAPINELRPGRTVGAVLLYHMAKPAGLPEGRQLGPYLTLVQVQEALDWPSLCQP
jgi:hypothetical protein